MTRNKRKDGGAEQPSRSGNAQRCCDFLISELRPKCGHVSLIGDWVSGRAFLGYREENGIGTPPAETTCIERRGWQSTVWQSRLPVRLASKQWVVASGTGARIDAAANLDLCSMGGIYAWMSPPANRQMKQACCQNKKPASKKPNSQPSSPSR